MPKPIPISKLAITNNPYKASLIKIEIKATKLNAKNVDQYSALLDLPLGFVQFDNLV